MGSLGCAGGMIQVVRKNIGFIAFLLLALLVCWAGYQSAPPAEKPPSPPENLKPLVIQDGYQLLAGPGVVSIRKNNLPIKTIPLEEADVKLAYRLSAKPSGQAPLMDYSIDSAVVLSGPNLHYVVELKPEIRLLLKYPRPLHDGGQSIRIEKAANRLYLYADGWLLKSYKVSTGKMPWYTPEGDFRIVNKMPFPKGRDPESPMGTRWMGLAVPYSKDERGNKWDGGDDPRSPLGQKFGIHGTNDESTIGIPASGGCIRMYNKDVNELYDLVDIGTPVQIVP